MITWNTDHEGLVDMEKYNLNIAFVCEWLLFFFTKYLHNDLFDK